VDDQISPLDVLLEAMRGYRETGAVGAAVAVAKAAAPYVHAKPARVRVAPPLRPLGDGELDELRRIAGRRTRAEGVGTG